MILFYREHDAQKKHITANVGNQSLPTYEKTNSLLKHTVRTKESFVILYVVLQVFRLSIGHRKCALLHLYTCSSENKGAFRHSQLNNRERYALFYCQGAEYARV